MKKFHFIFQIGKNIISSKPNIKKFYFFFFPVEYDFGRLHDSHRQTGCFYGQHNGRIFKCERFRKGLCKNEVSPIFCLSPFLEKKDCRCIFFRTYSFFKLSNWRSHFLPQGINSGCQACECVVCMT